MSFQHLFFFCFCILICSCLDEPDNNIPEDVHCLNNQLVEDGNLDCTDINNFCETELLGELKLSQSMKERFVDYCLSQNSFIKFKNEEGTSLPVEIKSKRYTTNRSILTLSPGNLDCKNYCLENEVAHINLECSRFNLDVSLFSHIKLNFDPQNEPQPQLTGSANIMARLGNTAQTVFSMHLEDANGMEIEQDTFSIRFHPSITLNGQTFSDIYSNENNNSTSLFRKEKIYFDPNVGLIAVRDSLGVLWSRD